MKPRRSHSCVALVLFGCQYLAGCQNVAPPGDGEEDRVVAECERNRDCESRICQPDLGYCVSDDVGYDELLLEVVPQSTDSRFGGLKLFVPLQEIVDSPRDPGSVELLVPPQLTGVVAPFYQPGLRCNISVHVSLIPRQRLLGIQSRRYTTNSERAFIPTSNDPVNQFTFSSVPAGTYDIYWEDAGEVVDAPDGCEVVPQLFRGVSIQGARELTLTQPETTPVIVQIPWPEGSTENLDGWTMDVVHPVTGQALSAERLLSNTEAEDGGYVQETDTGERIALVPVQVSQVVNDYGTPGQELLRLRPPTGVHRPTIYFVLFPLVTVEGGPAQVPGPVETFATQRRFEAWVWEDGDPTRPVPGRVEFIAQQLADEPDSFFRVRFSRSVDIAEDGKVALDLPPGVYIARIRPSDDAPSVLEVPVTVWSAQGARGTVQAGRVISVPRGASVQGRVRFPNGLSADSAQVELVTPGRSVAGVLAEQSLSPRTLSTLAGADGRFGFEHVDCNSCDEATNLDYLLRIVPPIGTELPWLLRYPFTVGGKVTNDSLSVSSPRVHSGHLGFLRANGSTGDFPSALIRGHLLLDGDNQALPATARSCLERRPDTPPEQPCVRRSIVVAETRTAFDGTFRLLLPPWE